VSQVRECSNVPWEQDANPALRECLNELTQVRSCWKRRGLLLEKRPVGCGVQEGLHSCGPLLFGAVIKYRP
jgi:hypothetical protein